MNRPLRLLEIRRCWFWRFGFDVSFESVFRRDSPTLTFLVIVKCDAKSCFTLTWSKRFASWKLYSGWLPPRFTDGRFPRIRWNVADSTIASVKSVRTSILKVPKWRFFGRSNEFFDEWTDFGCFIWFWSCNKWVVLEYHRFSWEILQ